MTEAEETAATFRTRIELLEIAHEEKISEEKAKIVQILEAGFNERQKLGMSAISHLHIYIFESNLISSMIKIVGFLRDNSIHCNMRTGLVWLFWSSLMNLGFEHRSLHSL